jgi:hypothetical protein
MCQADNHESLAMDVPGQPPRSGCPHWISTDFRRTFRDRVRGGGTIAEPATGDSAGGGGFLRDPRLRDRCADCTDVGLILLSILHGSGASRHRAILEASLLKLSRRSNLTAARLSSPASGREAVTGTSCRAASPNGRLIGAVNTRYPRLTFNSDWTLKSWRRCLEDGETSPHNSFGDKLNQFETDAKQWTEEAKACVADWYEQDLKPVREAAKKAADSAFNVDFSALRGRGPEFVLEFTAIVVIIFAAVILGVGSVLDSNQIGTLLAAIAGYVLGKAAPRRPSGSVDVQKTVGNNV